MAVLTARCLPAANAPISVEFRAPRRSDAGPCAPQVCRGVTPAAVEAVADQQLVEWPAACPVGVHANPHPAPALRPRGSASGSRAGHRTPGRRAHRVGGALRHPERPAQSGAAARHRRSRRDSRSPVRTSPSSPAGSRKSGPRSWWRSGSCARPGDEARVIFLVARISDDAGLGSNINARYTVESVEIEGLEEHEISAALRDRLQALVGTRLDPAEADQLIEELKAERPGYDVSRRIERGTRRGQIRVVFTVLRDRGAALDSVREVAIEVRLPLRRGVERRCTTSRWATATIASRSAIAVDDNDTLVEEYSGVRLRFETPAHRHRARRPSASRRRGSTTPGVTPTLLALEANPRDPRALSPAGDGGAGADRRAHPPRARERRRQPVEPRVAAPLARLADGERRDRLARLPPALGPRPPHPADRRGRLRGAVGGRTGSAAISRTRGTSAGRATSSRAAATPA